MILKLEAVGQKYKVLAASNDTWNQDLHPTLVCILFIFTIYEFRQGNFRNGESIILPRFATSLG